MMELIGFENEHISADSEREFQKTPIDRIRPDKSQPRRNFDEEALEDLAKSMNMVGQLQPIGIRRSGSDWMIVYGERRLRAARQLGWATINAIVYELPAHNMAVVLQACENLHRVDLGLNEYVEVVLRLKEAGMEPGSISRALSKNERWVGNLLSIARDPLARALIEGGRLNSADAWERFKNLQPEARKIVLDSTEPITWPRCESAKQQVQKLAGKRQSSIPLPPVDKQDCQTSVEFVETAEKDFPEVKMVMASDVKNPQARSGRAPVNSEETGFLIQLPIRICEKLIPGSGKKVAQGSWLSDLQKNFVQVIEELVDAHC
ncbi:MAG: ParB/RepB/Spo0J family partition protein [Ferrovum myxofaciens]|uniref:ParB/RepB/Spo0J family partition protein n=1 Tax=Ferrovum myxofaciens TaxID=416213 RepID=UPI002354D8D6|nr:ParB/RepB/Spo0J family partition protein [Ferrovum myxofaciens]QKE40033.1 MAG: ParB/RepB/Spo0J family partition protein [Ferrovum myxofaciens]